MKWYASPEVEYNGSVLNILNRLDELFVPKENIKISSFNRTLGPAHRVYYYWETEIKFDVKY